MKAIAFLSVVVMLASCTNNKAWPTDIAPPSTPVCDTLHVDYKTNILPIFRGNCYSCHSTATNNGGLDLEDTSSLKQYLQYSFRGDGLYGSKLYHCILHSQHALPMPPTYILDTCSLMKIKHWLKIGAPL